MDINLQLRQERLKFILGILLIIILFFATVKIGQRVVRFIFATSLFAHNVSTNDLSVKSSSSQRLLNVGYDVSRDFFQHYDNFFQHDYRLKKGVTVSVASETDLVIAQSFGASSKQAIAVKNGLPADVVSLNQSNDIELLVKSGLVDKNWQKAVPNSAMPFSSVMVLLVRKGNPKSIYDWSDIARDNIKVLFANPKTSGSGRYAFLSALGYAKIHNRSEKDQLSFMKKIIKNIPLLDAGSRSATISFTIRNIGDVLVTPENEAVTASKILGEDKFDIIYPSLSARVPMLVAEVTRNSKRHDNESLVKQYIKYLWSDEAQIIAAENHFRPTDPRILSEYKISFPKINIFDVNHLFGSWDVINRKYFSDGAIFDRLYQSYD